MRIPSAGALFGLGGLPAATQRGLAVAFATSIASVMGRRSYRVQRASGR